MSVILYEYREFEGVYNQLLKIPKLKDVVMNNNYVKEYNSRQMPTQMKYNFEDVLGRLLWYMYVANRVAYSLQYQRNEDIFTPEENAEKYTLDEAKQKFGSFMYNIYTNNGTVFLSKDWLGLAMDIKKFIYPKDFEKGGEVVEYSKVYEILKDKIEDAVADLYSTYENSERAEGEEVEYKSRSGFIPFTNGGYSSRWFEYSNMLEGSGISLPTKSLEDKIEEFRENNREYALERFEEEYPEIVEELGGIDNVDYSSLMDAGYDSEADDLEEFERDDDDSIMMEVEAFYYNPNNDRGEDGKHTIQLSGVVNLEAPYHRSGNLEDYIEERFTFDSYKELEDKLDKALIKVVSWFEGDMYDKNPRELKIRRMESGGTLPTPFGQAGLVGETGTLNEMELFSMGGGLPQGVHQYYANTYNPAYPTPHGYAKGGEITKTGNKGSARWEMKITDDEGKTSSIYAEKKSDLLQYKKMYLAKGGMTDGRKFKIVKEYDKLEKYGKNKGKKIKYVDIKFDDDEKVYELSKSFYDKYGKKYEFAKGGKTQGYNDKLDESLGNTKGKRSTKEQNYKDRRNESEAMEKKGGKRKYARVKTMDKGNRKKKMKTPMTLAKVIRKEGEKWQDAVKRASAMIRKDS